MTREGIFEPIGIYYRLNTGSAPRKTLVFIHGVSGSSVAWKAFESHFSPLYDTLSLDLRGHGRSLKYAEPEKHSLLQFAEDIHELIEHLTVREYALISHSFGSLVALEYLSRYSTEVSAAILISPTIEAKDQLPLRLIRFPLRAAAWVFSLFPSVAPTGRHIDYDTIPDRGDWDLNRRFVDIRNTSLRTYLYAMSQMYRSSKDIEYAALTMPILVLHGDKDTLFPFRKSERLAKLLPDAHFIKVAGADHILILKRTNEVISYIERFLKENFQ